MTIELKLGPSCGGFKCLICWKRVIPDDTLCVYGDGYAHVVCVEAKEKVENARERIREYLQRPEVKERRNEYFRQYYQRPEVKERHRERVREYDRRPEVKERQREYQQRPEAKEYR